MGVGSVDELKKVFREKDEIQNKQMHPTLKWPAHLSSLQQSPQAVSVTSTNNHTGTGSDIPKAGAGLRTLSSFLDIPKTLSLPQKEIETIWRLRHASSPRSLCAAIPYHTYKKLEATARRHPQFILPLAREGQGAEIHFLQWTFPSDESSTVLFTHLAEYKLRGEYARPHTTITHHLELADPKGLVLLEGMVQDGMGVSVEEGRWLLMSLQKFYAGEGIRAQLLEKFSTGDKEFKVEDVMEEAEKIL